MKILSIFLLACASTVAQAEVFKCTDQLGKIHYQSKSCQPTATERHLDIKTDPVKEAEGKVKMEALQTEYDGNKARQIEAEKQSFMQNN